MDADIELDTHRALFAGRVLLAKMTEDEAVAAAKKELAVTLAWVASPAKKAGSFLWYCDLFDLEPSAVRRAIQERVK